ncbi:MAG: tetratricopeptide repeat protein [Candidatus Wallbacteria bacterium]|nr:tetratricopeptide repeat protein [Candidatus Wallbacteria bacterium]
MIFIIFLMSSAQAAMDTAESKIMDYLEGRLPVLEFEFERIVPSIEQNASFYEGVVLAETRETRQIEFLTRNITEEFQENYPGEFGRAGMRLAKARDFIWLAYLIQGDTLEQCCNSGLNELRILKSMYPEAASENQADFLAAMIWQALGYYQNFIKEDIPEARNCFLNALAAFDSIVLKKYTGVQKELSMLLQGYAYLQLAQTEIDNMNLMNFQGDVFKAQNLFDKIQHYPEAKPEIQAESFLASGIALHNLGKMYKQVYSDYFRLKQYNQQARDFCGKFRERFPDIKKFRNETLMVSGYSYQSELDFEHAVTCYRELITTDKNSRWMGFAYSNLSSCLFLLHKYDDALDVYKFIYKNTSTDYDKVVSLIGMSNCYLNKRDYSMGLKYLARVIVDFHGTQETDISEQRTIAESKIWDMISVQILPEVEDVKPGESQEFTCKLIYRDGRDVPVPKSLLSWEWSCTGNDGDGHTFTSKGDKAVFGGGLLPFQQVLMRAKCTIDMYPFSNFILGKHKVQPGEEEGPQLQLFH